MIIIHDMIDSPLPRLVVKTLEDRLAVMPAVVFTGARQTGKTTLARGLEKERRRYRTLDDPDILEAADRDPESVLDTPGPMALDEVQRAPDLLHAVKLAIDPDRRPGRFLLTGSANLLLMRRVSESLAGRASYLTLHPMTRRERMGRGAGGLWEELIGTPEDRWLDLLAARPDEPDDWRALARKGGFPTPAVHLERGDARTVWFDGYVRTYLERDLQDLSAISALVEFRRLMRAAALRTGQTVNQTELGRDIALPQPTVRRYLNLLETSCLLARIPAYAVNRTKRLIKAPKLYWEDTGLALYLAGGLEPGGAHLENLVVMDLLAWRDARLGQAEILHWRTAAGEEVDFVVEAEGRLLPIEVKAASQPRLRDARHLRSFRAEYGPGTRPGLLLHTGSQLEWLTPDVLAAPWWRVM